MSFCIYVWCSVSLSLLVRWLYIDVLSHLISTSLSNVLYLFICLFSLGFNQYSSILNRWSHCYAVRGLYPYSAILTEL